MSEQELITDSKFALEEYKAIQEKIKNARDHLNRLEPITIGAAIISFGALLGFGAKMPDNVPVLSWWAIVFVLIFAGIRCGAHYFYILRLQAYVIQIEALMKSAGYKLAGFETYNRGKVLGPMMGFAANLSMWVMVVGTAIYLAVLKSKGQPVP